MLGPWIFRSTLKSRGRPQFSGTFDSKHSPNTAGEVSGVTDIAAVLSRERAPLFLVCKTWRLFFFLWVTEFAVLGSEGIPLPASLKQAVSTIATFAVRFFEHVSFFLGVSVFRLGAFS